MAKRRAAGFRLTRRVLLLGSAVGATLSSCLVSFKDYPVGDLDGGADVKGSGGTAGVGGTGGAELGGRAGADVGAGGLAGGGVFNTGGTRPTGGGGGDGGAAGDAPLVGTGQLVINEVDYDQDGMDTAEFVEVYNASLNQAADLRNIELVLINGADQVRPVYTRVVLSQTATALPPQSFLVVASPTTMVAASALTLRFARDSDNLQNGPEDAIALYDVASRQLVDALSYEGAVSAMIDGVSFDFVEGTATSAVDDVPQVGSLIRSPDGRDTENAAADWSFSTAPTPGSSNGG